MIVGADDPPFRRGTLRSQTICGLLRGQNRVCVVCALGERGLVQVGGFGEGKKGPYSRANG